MSERNAVVTGSSSRTLPGQALCPVCGLTASGADEVSLRFGEAPSRSTRAHSSGHQSWCRHCRRYGKEGLTLSALRDLCTLMAVPAKTSPLGRCLASLALLEDSGGGRGAVLPPVLISKGQVDRSAWAKAMDKRWGDLRADIYASRPRAKQGSESYWKKSVVGPIYRVLADLGNYDSLAAFRNVYENPKLPNSETLVGASKPVHPVVPLPTPAGKVHSTLPYWERTPEASDPVLAAFNLLILTIRATEGLGEPAAYARVVVLLSEELSKGVA